MYDAKTARAAARGRSVHTAASEDCISASAMKGERFFFDHPERGWQEIRVRFDGPEVICAMPKAVRRYPTETFADALEAGVIRSESVHVATQDAHRLHVYLAACRTVAEQYDRDHYAFASDVLGRPVESLAMDLNEAEREKVRRAARDAEGAEDYAGPQSPLLDFLGEMADLGAADALFWSKRILSKRISHVSALTPRERGDILRQCRYLHEKGAIGGRQPGQSLHRTRSQGRAAALP